MTFFQQNSLYCKEDICKTRSDIEREEEEKEKEKEKEFDEGELTEAGKEENDQTMPSQQTANKETAEKFYNEKNEEQQRNSTFALAESDATNLQIFEKDCYKKYDKNSVVQKLKKFRSSIPSPPHLNSNNFFRTNGCPKRHP